jgi:hypothetical protein
MEQLVGILAWPGVVLITALIALFLFRAPLTALIHRTKSVGKTGLETYEAQPAKPGDETKAIEEFFRTFDNPLILEAEALIQNDLKQRKIESPSDKERALIRSLASTNIILHFERVHSLIWASQLALLRFLNARDDGANVSHAIGFYEMGKKEFPAWYESYQIDQWLGFLESNNLIAKRDSRIFISIGGREFLKYLIAVGRPGPSYG